MALSCGSRTVRPWVGQKQRKKEGKGAKPDCTPQGWLALTEFLPPTRHQLPKILQSHNIAPPAGGDVFKLTSLRQTGRDRTGTGWDGKGWDGTYLTQTMAPAEAAQRCLPLASAGSGEPRACTPGEVLRFININHLRMEDLISPILLK